MFLLASACADEPPRRVRTFKAIPLSPLVQGDERAIEFADDADVADDLAWHSTNEKVASVTPNGRVRALAPGTAVLQGDGRPGAAEVQVKVSPAKLAWSQHLALGRRTFLAIAPGGPLFAKTVADPACTPECRGGLWVRDAATGKPLGQIPGVGRVVAAEDRAFLAKRDGLDVYDYASGTTSSLGYRGDLLGRFADGSLLLGRAAGLARTDMLGNDLAFTALPAPPVQAVIVGDDVYAAAGGKLYQVTGGTASAVDAGLTYPWAADYYGTLVLSDAAAYTFAVLRPVAGYRLLGGVYSVVIAENGLIESEGLSAWLSVPVAALAQGNLYLELQTYGTQGQYRIFDVVFRDGDIYHWRWGPSQCSDHPFAVAVVPGSAYVSSCDRLARVDDPGLRTVGAWPQPAADAARSWRAQ